MGMFDEILINVDLPKFPKGSWGQTKSLENMLWNYEITEEGRLRKLGYEDNEYYVIEDYPLYTGEIEVCSGLSMPGYIEYRFWFAKGQLLKVKELSSLHDWSLVETPEYIFYNNELIPWDWGKEEEE